MIRSLPRWKRHSRGSRRACEDARGLFIVEPAVPRSPERDWGFWDGYGSVAALSVLGLLPRLGQHILGLVGRLTLYGSCSAERSSVATPLLGSGHEGLSFVRLYRHSMIVRAFSDSEETQFGSWKREAVSRVESSSVGTRREVVAIFRFFDNPASVVLTYLCIMALFLVEVLGTAMFQRSFIDHLLARDSAGVLTSGVGLLSMALLYMIVVSFWRAKRIAYSAELAANMRKALVRKLFSIKPERAEQVDPGEFGSRATSDINAASEIITPLFCLVLVLVEAIAASVCVILLEPRLGTLTVVCCPFIVWLGNRLSAPLTGMGEETQDSYAQIWSWVTDSLANRDVVRVLGLEPQLVARFARLNERAYRANRRVASRMARLEGMIWFFAEVILLAMVLVVKVRSRVSAGYRNSSRWLTLARNCSRRRSLV